MKKFLLALALMTPACLMAGEFDGVMGIVKRRAPWLGGHVVFKKIGGEEGKMTGQEDAFRLSMEGGKVVVSATGPNAAAEGLDWYLKYYCHRSMSHMGDNLGAVAVLPVVKEPVTVRAVARYRHVKPLCSAIKEVVAGGWGSSQ